MFRETVRIIGIAGDKIKVKFAKRKSCSCCKLNSLCGGEESTLLIDKPKFVFSPGDKIEVAVSEKKSIIANILIFLIPGIVFLASLVIFKSYGELSSFFLAMGVICTYYIIIKLLLKKIAKKFYLEIIKKV